jgi:hypothetical protein
VVRIDTDSFAIDTCCSFRLSTSAGLYSSVGDAFADIIQALGMGPIFKWVDDHVFFQIPKEHISKYNRKLDTQHATIKRNSNPKVDGCCVWYAGNTLPNSQIKEYDTDCAYQLKDLSHNSPRSAHDAKFSYNLQDVDSISTDLGIPWEISKDIPFSSQVMYIGLIWDIADRTVSLSESKHEKYLNAIKVWKNQRTHTLNELQKLYGKLLHASLIYPASRAYLTNLEVMIPIFGNKPFMPRTPP